MALTKVSGGILDPGINVAGIVTATGFDGPFVGGSDGINAGVGTFTGLDVNGNGDISGNLVVGGNFTANGDFTTLNTTLREVELLRVDADASVAAGIITQTGAGHGLVLADDTTFKMAMNVGSGIATFRALNAGYTGHNGAAGIFQQVDLNTAAVTFGNTISVNGATITTGNGSHRIRSAANDFAIESTTSAYKGFRFLGNVPENTLVVDDGNSGSVGIGSEIPSEKLDVNGNIKASGKIIAYDASSTSNQVRARIKATASDDDGRVGVYYGNTEVAALFGKWSGSAFSTGLNIPFEPFVVTGSSGAERLRIRSDGGVGIGTENNFGGSMLSIYGADVGEGTAKGQLVIKDTAAYNASPTAGILFQGIHAANSQAIFAGIRGFKENATNGNYAGALAFDVRANGAVAYEALRITSAGEVRIPAGSNSTSRLTFGGGINIYHDGNMKFENGTGYLKLQSSNNVYIDGAELFFRNSGGTNRWKIDSSGHLLPGAVGSYDIGSTSAEIGNVYLADNKHIYFGNEQDLDIRFDSSNAAITLDTGTLSIINYANNEDVKILSDSGGGGVVDYIVADGSTGEVLLNHYGSQKLATSTTGISVTGEVAASQDYPNIRPTLDFNFAAEKKLDPRITYRRTGPASFVNEFGKVVIVGDNAPRFDYDPTTRESKGLLIEESRTNQWLYSEDIATYITGGNLQQSTLANTTATTDPTGGTDAVLMAATANGGAHSFYKNFTSGSNGDNHTFSVWVKAAGVDYARIYVDTVGGSLGGPGVTFSTKNTWNVSATGVATQVATSAVEYPNGWWRLSVTGSYSNRNDFYFHIDLEGGEGDIGFTGNGSNGAYVWGVQAEAGGFPTSYIPTNGSTATRGNESFEIDGEDFTDFFNATEGTVLSHITPLNGSLGNHSGTGGVVWSFDAGGGFGNGHYFSNANSTTAFAHAVMVGSSGQNTAGGTGNQTNGVPFKNATIFKKDDFIMATNGTLASADTSGNLPTVVKLVLGNNGWGNALNAANVYLNRFAYYPKRLPNTQLVTLTS